MIKFALVNESQTVKDEDLSRVAWDLYIQANYHFGPYWNIQCQVQAFTGGHAVPKEYWPLVLKDDSDVPGALGYHDFEVDLPTAYVFARTCAQYGTPYGSVLSHELLETLADPDANLTALNEDTGVLYAYEVCDPVENNVYLCGKTMVSDFVMPSWFVTTGKAPFSWLQRVKNPFTLDKGGYISYIDISNTQGWQQITARAQAKYGKTRD